MLQSFSAVNFRCFKNLTIDSMSRVNLIAGKNNVGKTSLLEALFLHFGPPSHPTQFFDFLRTLERISIRDQEYWEWLFLNKKQELTIKLSSLTDGGVSRELSVRLVEPDTFTLGMEETGTGTGDLGTRFILNLDYLEKHADGETSVRFEVSPSGIVTTRAKSTTRSSVPSAPWVYLGAFSLASAGDTERFGQLEKVGRQNEVVSILRLLEPRLSRLALIVTNGEPILHGEIGIGYMVPVRLMGEGIRRLLSISLAIAKCPGGICLIDEIENGLHYSVTKDVWKAIAHAARKMNVQVFATTHSWECIQSAHHAFKESGPYELRYYRLDRGEGDISVKTMDERMLDAVERTDLEVR